MKISSLRTRLTVQSKTRTADTVDGKKTGGSSVSWADVATVSAEVKPLSAAEVYRQDKLNAEKTHTITIRYRADIEFTADMRFVDVAASRVFACLGEPVKDIDGKTSWLRFNAKEGVLP